MLAVVRANAERPRVLATWELGRDPPTRGCPNGMSGGTLRAADWSRDGKVRAIVVEWQTGADAISGAALRWDGARLALPTPPIALGSCLHRRTLQIEPTDNAPLIRAK
jgi:hypothetical protein